MRLWRDDGEGWVMWDAMVVTIVTVLFVVAGMAAAGDAIDRRYKDETGDDWGKWI